jgi:hypothetical protein
MVFVGLVLSVHAFSGPSKEDVQKLNNSLIFDFFMNYELTEKNGNLVTIVDFIPSFNNSNYNQIKLESNIGGENQHCSFIYNDNGTIGNIAYEVNEKIYRYDLIYKGSKLTNIKITGKPKISFVYDKNGRLLTINRERGGGVFAYNFEYAEGENEAQIKLIVIQNEKINPSTSKYYVTWNSAYKIESYCLVQYCSKNIMYTDKLEISSYSFSSVNEDKNIATWEYTAFDDKQNWTLRKSKEIFFHRFIEYK